MNMIDQFPTTKDFEKSQKLKRNFVTTLVVAAICVVVGTMTAIAYLLPQQDTPKIMFATAALLALLAIPVVVAYRPQLGLYIVFIGSLLFPQTHDLQVPTMPASYVPFWWNVSTIGQTSWQSNNLNGLAISPAEIIMVLTFLVWIVRTVALRQFKFNIGPFFWPIAAYMAMVAVGFVNGITHGGNITMALYEVRGQAYFFLVYVMMVNLVEERRQLMTLLWLVVICNFIQGLGGTITYLLNRSTITEDGFMQHDESLILNLVFFVAMMAGSLGVDRRLRWAAIAVTPFALMAVLGNQRRASIAAFIIAFIPMLPMLWTLLKSKRAQIGKLGIIFGLTFAIYLPLAWNANGPLALPARAIRSQTEPSARDAASNGYRDSENFDVTTTRDASPIIGYGYGKPFMQPVPLPAVSTDFVYYMPHNSVLWVWMRLGHIGFFLFWMMISVFIIRGLEILKSIRLPETRLIGLLAITMVLMMLTFGKFDLALVDLRVLTITAVLLGALAVLPKIEKQAGEGGTPLAPVEDDEDIKTDLAYGPLTHGRNRGALPF